jgi:hypothetical protein
MLRYPRLEFWTLREMQIESFKVIELEVHIGASRKYL